MHFKPGDIDGHESISIPIDARYSFVDFEVRGIALSYCKTNPSCFCRHYCSEKLSGSFQFVCFIDT